MRKWPANIEKEVAEANQWISDHFFRIVLVLALLLYLTLRSSLAGHDAFLTFVGLLLLGLGIWKCVKER